MPEPTAIPDADAVQGSLWSGPAPPLVRAKRARNPTSLPLKWHGGKFYLTDWIISLMPPHHHYVEPYFGGGAVLFAKDPESVSEIVCDKCQLLMNFWATLQFEATFAAFSRRVSAIPFCEQQYETALVRSSELLQPEHDYAHEPDPELAAAFFVVCRQSLAGRMDSFAPATTGRLRRGMNEQVSAWLSCVDNLPPVATRLKRVFMHAPQPALPLIRKYDKLGLVMYLDPPYPKDTRESPDVYEHEMSLRDHRELLTTVKQVRHAKVLLSSYPNELYDTMLKNWRRETKEVDNKASGKRRKEKKIEAVYMNY